MRRVEAPDLAGLRAVLVELETGRDRLALLHQRAGVLELLRHDEVEGPDLVVRAPAAPVRAFLRHRLEIGHGEGDVVVAARHGFLPLLRSSSETCSGRTRGSGRSYFSLAGRRLTT